jgi:aminoglycoside phosphotransferase (APT) family kinase protein
VSPPRPRPPAGPRPPVALRRARWGFRHLTWIADTGGGRLLVIQRRADGSDPTNEAARAVRARVRETSVGVPEPLRCTRHAGGTTVVLPYVEGDVAADLLAREGGAAVAGRACGEVAARLGSIDPAGLGLTATWASGPALRAAAAEWQVAVGLGDGAATKVADALDRAAGELDLGRVAPRFAHGDLAPVNVLVSDGRPVAVLDLDRACLAHPALDAAWFAWVVSFHHPEIAGEAWAAFAAAAGLGRTPLDAVSWLWPLLLLERAAEATSQAERDRWLARLAGAWSG